MFPKQFTGSELKPLRCKIWIVSDLFHHRTTKQQTKQTSIWTRDDDGHVWDDKEEDLWNYLHIDGEKGEVESRAHELSSTQKSGSGDPPRFIVLSFVVLYTLDDGAPSLWLGRFFHIATTAKSIVSAATTTTTFVLLSIMPENGGILHGVSASRSSCPEIDYWSPTWFVWPMLVIAPVFLVVIT